LNLLNCNNRLHRMEGGELFDLIVQETRFPEVHARRLARQMLSALDYLHDKGICHRDLKVFDLVSLNFTVLMPLSA